MYHLSLASPTSVHKDDDERQVFESRGLKVAEQQKISFVVCLAASACNAF